MSTARKTLRTDLRAALVDLLADYPALADAPVISAWAQNIDAASLPIVGVATPLETREAASLDQTQATITAVVVVKRADPDRDDGPGLEDLLDADAQALTPGIEAALIGDNRLAELRSSAIDISGAGSPRIGTLTLTFEVATLVPRTLP